MQNLSEFEILYFIDLKQPHPFKDLNGLTENLLNKSVAPSITKHLQEILNQGDYPLIVKTYFFLLIKYPAQVLETSQRLNLIPELLDYLIPEIETNSVNTFYKNSNDNWILMILYTICCYTQQNIGQFNTFKKFAAGLNCKSNFIFYYLNSIYRRLELDLCINTDLTNFFTYNQTQLKNFLECDYNFMSSLVNDMFEYKELIFEKTIDFFYGEEKTVMDIENLYKNLLQSDNIFIVLSNYIQFLNFYVKYKKDSQSLNNIKQNLLNFLREKCSYKNVLEKINEVEQHDIYRVFDLLHWFYIRDTYYNHPGELPEYVDIQPNSLYKYTKTPLKGMHTFLTEYIKNLSDIYNDLFIDYNFLIECKNKVNRLFLSPVLSQRFLQIMQKNQIMYIPEDISEDFLQKLKECQYLIDNYIYLTYTVAQQLVSGYSRLKFLFDGNFPLQISLQVINPPALIYYTAFDTSLRTYLKEYSKQMSLLQLYTSTELIVDQEMFDKFIEFKIGLEMAPFFETVEKECTKMIEDLNNPIVDTMNVNQNNQNGDEMIVDQKKQNGDEMIVDQKKQNGDEMIVDQKKQNRDEMIVDVDIVEKHNEFVLWWNSIDNKTEDDYTILKTLSLDRLSKSSPFYLFYKGEEVLTNEEAINLVSDNLKSDVKELNYLKEYIDTKDLSAYQKQKHIKDYINLYTNFKTRVLQNVAHLFEHALQTKQNFNVNKIGNEIITFLNTNVFPGIENVNAEFLVLKANMNKDLAFELEKTADILQTQTRNFLINTITNLNQVLRQLRSNKDVFDLDPEAALTNAQFLQEMKLSGDICNTLKNLYYLVLQYFSNNLDKKDRDEINNSIYFINEYEQWSLLTFTSLQPVETPNITNLSNILDNARSLFNSFTTRIQSISTVNIEFFEQIYNSLTDSVKTIQISKFKQLWDSEAKTAYKTSDGKKTLTFRQLFALYLLISTRAINALEPLDFKNMYEEPTKILNSIETGAALAPQIEKFICFTNWACAPASAFEKFVPRVVIDNFGTYINKPVDEKKVDEKKTLEFEDEEGNEIKTVPKTNNNDEKIPEKNEVKPIEKPVEKPVKQVEKPIEKDVENALSKIVGDIKSVNIEQDANIQKLSESVKNVMDTTENSFQNIATTLKNNNETSTEKFEQIDITNKGLKNNITSLTADVLILNSTVTTGLQTLNTTLTNEVTNLTSALNTALEEIRQIKNNPVYVMLQNLSLINVNNLAEVLKKVASKEEAEENIFDYYRDFCRTGEEREFLKTWFEIAWDYKNQAFIGLLLATVGYTSYMYLKKFIAPISARAKDLDELSKEVEKAAKDSVESLARLGELEAEIKRLQEEKTKAEKEAELLKSAKEKAEKEKEQAEKEKKQAEKEKEAAEKAARDAKTNEEQALKQANKEFEDKKREIDKDLSEALERAKNAKNEALKALEEATKSVKTDTTASKPTATASDTTVTKDTPATTTTKDTAPSPSVTSSERSPEQEAEYKNNIKFYKKNNMSYSSKRVVLENPAQLELYKTEFKKVFDFFKKNESSITNTKEISTLLRDPYIFGKPVLPPEEIMLIIQKNLVKP